MIVYWSGGYGHEYLITMEIDPNGKNNLKRENIVDEDYALYWCEEAKIIDIQHKETNESHKHIYGYKIGEMKKIPYSEFSGGIYFYTTKEAAMELGNWHGVKTGKTIRRYISGLKSEENTVQDGQYNGICKAWHTNGQLRIECNFVYGNFDGLYQSWHPNGKRELLCYYKEDKLEGIYLAWDREGNDKKFFVYKEGEVVDKIIDAPPPAITFFDTHPHINNHMFSPLIYININV